MDSDWDSESGRINRNCTHVSLGNVDFKDVAAIVFYSQPFIFLMLCQVTWYFPLLSEFNKRSFKSKYWKSC